MKTALTSTDSWCFAPGASGDSLPAAVRSLLPLSIKAIRLMICLLFSGTSLAGAPLQKGWVTLELDGMPVDVHYLHAAPTAPEEPAQSLLFIHGFPTSNAIWMPVMKRLSDIVNVDLYAISMPGFGHSSTPSPQSFDYSETGLNRVPFAAADALGIDRFIGVVHDLGGPWFLCPASEPENLARLDGLVVLDTGINVLEQPLEPAKVNQLFAELMEDSRVPQWVIALILMRSMETATATPVRIRFPEVVSDIVKTNSRDGNRAALSRNVFENTVDPLAFGGICANEVAELDLLEPLLLFSLCRCDTNGGTTGMLPALILLSAQWPSAHWMLLPGTDHFLMLDQPGVIAAAIAEYVTGR
jgi:pimeloyl-ACP methyl ester carboxylesterase